jgi:polar amino acid transport system substrate-binding protein
MNTKLILALCLCFCGSLTAEPLGKSLVFSIDSFYAQPIYDDHPAKDLMRQALANLCYTYQLRYIQGPRSLAVANLGEVDGEFARNHDHTGEFHNLVWVPEPVNSVRSIIVSRRSLAGEERNWHQLEAQNRIVIPGSRVGQSIPARFAPLATVKASDYDQALKLVARGRADMVIIPANFNFLASRYAGKKDPLVVLSPTLEEEAAYMHLHKRHQDLVAPLAAELKKLKRERDQSP